MSSQPADDNRDLESYRGYLRLLAQLQLDQRLLGKVDLSGVVQQTMWEAHQAWATYERQDGNHLAAWLRQILARNLSDEVRKFKADKRDVSREQSLERELENSSNRLDAWLAADQSSPSQSTQLQEQALHLAAALAKLPSAQQEALILRHLREMSLAEIAQEMGRSHGAVAGLIKRGLQQLRTQLGDWK